MGNDKDNLPEYDKDSVSFARYINPHNGNVAIVRAQGVPYDEGSRQVHAPYDNGQLFCICCDAKVSYTPLKDGVAGSTDDRTIGHFAAINGHEEKCRFFDPSLHNFPTRDYTKGPRIDIDTASDYDKVREHFGYATGVYRWEGDRKFLNDEDMRDRPLEKVGDVADFLRLIDRYLRAGKEQQLNQARVVFQNNAQDWRQTIIRLGTPSRHADLVDRVMARPRGAEPPFAVVEVMTTKHHDARPRPIDKSNPKSKKTVPAAPIDPIYIGKTQDGLEKYVQYGIYIEGPHSDFQRFGMYEAATYYVMGEVRGNHSIKVEPKDGEPGRVTHHLYIKVTDHRQVARVSTESILENAAKPRIRVRKPKAGEVPPGIYPLSGE